MMMVRAALLITKYIQIGINFENLITFFGHSKFGVVANHQSSLYSWRPGMCSAKQADMREMTHKLNSTWGYQLNFRSALLVIFLASVLGQEEDKYEFEECTSHRQCFSGCCFELTGDERDHKADNTPGPQNG